jgi:hypothetical protein
MNEYSPEVASYKDRSTGLIVFGILTILLGCLCELLVLGMFAGQALAASQPDAPQTDIRAILPAIFMYGGLGVALVWLGIGTMMARRWARALMLIFSWSWLITGVLVMVMMAFLMPKIMANMQAHTAGHAELPPAAMIITMVVMMTIDGFLFIVLPAIWTFFYNSRHVKATCEARQPVPSWTDACPLPVLALCIWSVMCVFMMLTMPFVAHGVMPFFGMFLSGIMGTLFCLVLAVIWGGAAWLSYKLDVRGWWLLMITFGVLAVSMILTYSLHDITEAYHLMGYPEAQIAQIKQAGMGGNTMVWISSVCMLPFLGYLLFIKRYFNAKA